MPKSRHRAPSLCLRQWVVWAVAALVVAAAFAFVSLLGGGSAPVAWTFVLLLLCFMTGSLASSMFLSHPMRPGGHIVLPAVREPEAIEAVSVESERVHPHPHPQPQPEPVADRPRITRSDSEVPSFASTNEIGGSLGVTVLISSSVGTDPARGGAAGLGLAELSEVHVTDSIPVQTSRTSVAAIEAEPVVLEEESGPFPGAVRAKPNGQSPDRGYRVKGNTRSKRYHTMQSPYYERTKATVWFRSAADAERAGFAAWNSKVQNSIQN
ncbi:hypothetical protein GCM10027597_20940 [Saccharopolyspora tripterygii]